MFDDRRNFVGWNFLFEFNFCAHTENNAGHSGHWQDQARTHVDWSTWGAKWEKWANVGMDWGQLSVFEVEFGVCDWVWLGHQWVDWSVCVWISAF